SVAVVALLHSRGADRGALPAARGLLVLVALLVRARIWWLPLHVGLGVGVGLALWGSGGNADPGAGALGPLLPPPPPASPGPRPAPWPASSPNPPARPVFGRCSARPGERCPWPSGWPTTS